MGRTIGTKGGTLRPRSTHTKCLGEMATQYLISVINDSMVPENVTQVPIYYASGSLVDQVYFLQENSLEV